jgi:acetyl-CoA synthetase
LAKPAEIKFTDALPKTRSGKIMRRLLREIVTTHGVTGDVATLEGHDSAFARGHEDGGDEG